MTHAAFAAVTADAFVGMILRLSALLTNAHASSCVTLRRTLSTKASRRSIECRRFIDSLNCRYLHDITRRLPSDLDPNVAAEYLFDEFYWETRCSVLYPRQALLAEQHGLSWKQLFFEIHMQQHFEAFGGNDHVMPPGILTTLNACQDSIFTLRAEQLPGHPDLSQLLQKLHNITIVNLTYGVKKVGMNFDRMLFGMKASSVACCDFYYRCSTDCRC
mmetsp:Transcript_9506/g.38799  ORF Transcript_9506/g.38799 Transcript_9506/m.38799 type:complete len:217 (+) Transcript_9506:171-821(+)